jgi:hypothetical protein
MFHKFYPIFHAFRNQIKLLSTFIVNLLIVNSAINKNILHLDHKLHTILQPKTPISTHFLKIISYWFYPPTNRYVLDCRFFINYVILAWYIKLLVQKVKYIEIFDCRFYRAIKVLIFDADCVGNYLVWEDVWRSGTYWKVWKL